MNDKILDNLNNPIENELSTSERGTPEKLSAKEVEKTQIEKTTEKKFVTEKYPAKPAVRVPKRTAMPLPKMRDEVVIKIEKILESGLAEEYSKLSPIAKQEFKIKGEEVAEKIKDILSSTHIKVKKIFSLIVEWLRLLPGVNKFFLEQEAKIKTDHLIELHKKQQEKESNKLI
jgi:hypothetical protein